MDTRETPSKDDIPRELLAAARAITQVDSDLFVFGGFPRVDAEKALVEARRRWILACKFDLALRMWEPAIDRTARHLVKAVYGVADPAAAESAWLDAVFLWPDHDSQEWAASRIWALDDNGAANSDVHHARTLIQVLRTKYRRNEVARDRQATKNLLADQKLRTLAREDWPHLRPELWFRHAVLRGRKPRHLSYRGGWREIACVEIGKMIPKTLGHDLEHDAWGICLVFAQVYRWAKKNLPVYKAIEKKKPGILFLKQFNRMSVSETACEITARVLKRIGYPKPPSKRTVQRIVTRSKFIHTHLKAKNLP